MTDLGRAIMEAMAKYRFLSFSELVDNLYQIGLDFDSNKVYNELLALIDDNWLETVYLSASHESIRILPLTAAHMRELYDYENNRRGAVKAQRQLK